MVSNFSTYLFSFIPADTISDYKADKATHFSTPFLPILATLFQTHYPAISKAVKSSNPSTQLKTVKTAIFTSVKQPNFTTVIRTLSEAVLATHINAVQSAAAKANWSSIDATN
jgi:hypothetical protein